MAVITSLVLVALLATMAGGLEIPNLTLANFDEHVRSTNAVLVVFEGVPYTARPRLIQCREGDLAGHSSRHCVLC